MTRGLVWILFMLVGAVVLAPAIAILGLEPLPGDITFMWGNAHIYLPFTTALIVSVSLTLLFFLFRR